jgi:hypothetical protein
VDRLIREVIETRRWPTPGEIVEIADRIASAPFDPQSEMPVRMKHRRLRYEGQTLGARASALMYHLVKRVVDDQQRAFGTTAVEYVVDLWRAVQSSDARMVLYGRRGGCLATVIARNHIPTERRGDNSLPWIMVVYSADHGTIITGYQISSNAPSNIPEDGLWLR